MEGVDLAQLVAASDGPRSPREALDAARAASNPAEVVKHLFLVCAYQQQQIEALELALGVQDAEETMNIRARAERLREGRARTRVTGGQ